LKLKILNGVLIVDILSILLIIIITFIPVTVVRVVLGLPFLLFFPGYVLMDTLFVKNNEISTIERVALSVGMSIAIVALIGFVLNYTPWGIRLESILYSVTAFIFLTSAFALVRRVRALITNPFTSEFTVKLPIWGSGKFNNPLSISLTIIIFITLGVLSYTIAAPKVGETFMEFYILGAQGKAQDYPIEYSLKNGQIIQIKYSDGTIDDITGFGTITLGIINHEQQTIMCSVKMTIDGEQTSINFNGTATNVIGPIVVKQGEKWEEKIGIVPQHLGNNQKVELLLFKINETTPENSLHFWINVKQEGS
jgi:uncharacterized membrane protein